VYFGWGGGGHDTLGKSERNRRDTGCEMTVFGSGPSINDVEMYGVTKSISL
jgi:hypothetical protein